MIWINIPGFVSSDFSGGETRLGDAQIITDGINFDIIDGYCGKGATKLISALKKIGIKTPYLHISHAHWDHYDGIRKIIRDSYFKPKRLYLYDPSSLGDVSSDVKSEKATLRNIVSEAKAKGIPVTYLKNGDRVTHGDIKFTVFRDQPMKYNGNSDAYINNGSLCYWFNEIRYLTTGDAGLECARKHNLNPMIIKIGHHGNDCIRSEATWLKNHGCVYCWDNDHSVKLTDFLMTGREDCLAVGMKYFGCHGDINIICANKTGIIYKDGGAYKYKCDYAEKATLKGANLAVVKATLKGTYGANNDRITNLIRLGYWPSQVQDNVNEIVKLVKG